MTGQGQVLNALCDGDAVPGVGGSGPFRVIILGSLLEAKSFGDGEEQHKVGHHLPRFLIGIDLGLSLLPH